MADFKKISVTVPREMERDIQADMKRLALSRSGVLQEWWRRRRLFAQEPYRLSAGERMAIGRGRKEAARGETYSLSDLLDEVES